MVKENFKPIINQQKLVEEVRELEESSWWKEHQSSVNKPKLSLSARNKVISRSGSDFVSERGKEGYGPMPFADEATALVVARSDAIMSRLSEDYRSVVSLFNHNRKGTVEWLKAEGALDGFDVVHKFNVPFPNGYSKSKSPTGAWSEYRIEIEKYVENLCKEWRDERGNFYGRLAKAREKLADHIHRKYYDRFPKWPSQGEKNEGSIKLDTGDAYEADAFYIIWSCIGWVDVKDERYLDRYMAEFRGNPDTKILQIDFDKLGELDRKVNRLGLSEAKRMIDAKEGTRRLTWNDFK